MHMSTVPSVVFANLTKHPTDPGIMVVAFTAFKAGNSRWYLSLNDTRIRGPLEVEELYMSTRLPVLKFSDLIQSGGWRTVGHHAPRAYGPMSIIQNYELVRIQSSKQIFAGEQQLSLYFQDVV